MIERWIVMLSWVGVIGIPGALCFAAFWSTLGPEKPTEQAPTVIRSSE